MVQFNKKTQESLGYYVYGLIDPRNNKIFYVGKASANNRAFDHLKETKTESLKTKLIASIRKDGLEPKVEILRYGLDSEKTVFEVEAAIIDAIGIDNLTNQVRGHGIEKGRLTLEEVIRLYDSDPIFINEIEEKYMTIFINKTYSTNLTEIELYDATRQFWYNVSETTRTAKEQRVALSIFDSVVVRVYKIEKWFDAGKTLSTRTIESMDNRYEFVGQKIDNHKLLGKKLVDDKGQPLKSNQLGYGYIN